MTPAPSRAETPMKQEEKNDKENEKEDTHPSPLPFSSIRDDENEEESKTENGKRVGRDG